MTDADPDAVDSITVYSDYVCPFCYLGRESLARYRAAREEPLAVEWQPFDLRSGQRGPDGEIDTGVDDGKDEEYYAEARANVERLQERYDVEMAQSIATDVDSLNAQLVSLSVREEQPDQWLDFDWAIFEALWQDGRDIGDPDVLAELAESVGLDSETVHAALADDELRGRLDEQFAAARSRGITGVPTFAFEGHVARGAVPPEQLRRLVEGT